MKLKLHHVNLCSTNVPAMDEFYRTVLDLKPEPGLNENRTPGGGYPGKVAFVSDGTTQLHLAEKDLGVNFRHRARPSNFYDPDGNIVEVHQVRG